MKNKTTKYYIDDTDAVTVKIDNKTKDYKDLYNLYDDGDSTITVTLTLNKKDYVTKITATTSDSDSKDDADGNVASVTYKESKDTGTVKIGSKTYDIDDVDDVDISITDGSDTTGVAYILLQDQRDGRKYWGVGVSHNINLAPLRGILSAINRSKRSAQ